MTCNRKGRRMLGWEFPPREPSKKKTAAKKAATKKVAKKKAAAKKDN